MATPIKTVTVATSESSEEKGPYMAESNEKVLQCPMNSRPHCTSYGPVAIFWDIENCPVPSDVRPEDVAGNVRMALRIHPIIRGAIVAFSAYGDFNAFPRRVREGCQRTGVKLIDVPNGRKDAADKAILIDMFLFALDNPPPSSIILISGDVDFAPALHILGQRGYTVILVIPAGFVSSALSSAGKFVWDWSSVAHGEGFVPPSKQCTSNLGNLSDIHGHLIGLNIDDNMDGQNEEAIVYRGLSQSYSNSQDLNVALLQSSSQYNCLRSYSLPSGLNEVATGPISSVDQIEYPQWVLPGDLNGLKNQLVKLLELSGGCLPFTRVPAEYQKIYGRPLYISEYGVFKLVNLFKKMGDVMSVDGKGNKKFVYLRNWKAGPSAPPLVPVQKNKIGKGDQEEILHVHVTASGCSSDDVSDEERVVEEHDDRGTQGKLHNGRPPRGENGERYLEQFKFELQEILVSYSCQIFVGCFEAIYQQRYKKPLELRRFGVNNLEDLLGKVRDVVELHEDPVTKGKFLAAAVGG